MKKSKRKWLSLGSISLIVINTTLNNFLFVPIVDAFDSTMTGTVVQSNVTAVAQSDTITPNRFITTGETASININGQLYSQVFDTTNELTMQLLSTQINSSTGVSSSYSQTGNTLTLTARIPGQIFVTSDFTIQALTTTPTRLVNNIVAVAQQSQAQISQPLLSGDRISINIGGQTISQIFSGSKTQTLTLFTQSITDNTSVQGTLSGTDSLTFTAKVPGQSFGFSDIAIESSSISSIEVTPNIIPVSQINNIKIGRAIYSDESLNISINGNNLTQAFTTDSSTTITNLINQINAITGVSSSLSGDELIINSTIPGTAFTSSALTLNGGTISSVNITPNTGSQAQINTLNLPRNLSTGDRLTTTINNTLIQIDFSNSNEETLNLIRGAIDGLTNLNAQVVTGQNNIIISSTLPGTPFSIENTHITTSINSTNVVPNNVGQRHIVSVQSPRSLISGDSLSVVVNGNSLNQDFSGDSDSTLLSLSNQIDALSNISASYSSNTITINSDITGNALTIGNLHIDNLLTPQVIVANVEPVAQKNIFTIPQDLVAGDSINLNINGNSITQTFDTDKATTLSGLNQQIGSLDSVSSMLSTNSFEITAKIPGSGFSVSNILTTGVPFSGTTLTGNTPETRANLELTITSVPTSGEVLAIGTCNITFGSGDNELDCSDGQVFVNNEGATIQDIIDRVSAVTGIQDENNGVLNTSASGTNILFERNSSQDSLTGIYFSGTDTISGIANSPMIATTQVDQIVLPRQFAIGDSFTLILNGSGVIQTFLSDHNTSITNLINQLNVFPNISATLTGTDTIIIQSSIAGSGFELGTGQFINTQSSTQTIANNVGAAQKELITIPFALSSGDTIGVNINSNLISGSFVTDTINTLNQLAQNITSGVNNIISYSSGSNGLVIESSITGQAFTIGNVQISNQILSTEIAANISGVAQIDEIVLPFTPMSGDNISIIINGNHYTQAFDTDIETTLSGLNSQLNTATGVNSSFSTGEMKFTLTSTLPGVAFTAGLLATGATISSTNIQPNNESGAQLDSLVVDRSIVSGDLLSFYLNGTGLLQSFTGDKNSTLSGITEKINSIEGVSGSYDGDITIQIQSEIPGVGFSGGVLTIFHTTPSTNVQANVPAQAQQIEVSLPRNIINGDRINLSVDSHSFSQTFTGDETTTLNLLKTQIDGSTGGAFMNISGSDLIFSAKVPGVSFTISGVVLTNTVSTSTTQNNVEAVAQVDSIILPVFGSGDHYGLSIDSHQISGDFNTSSQQTVTDIISAINGIGTLLATTSGEALIITASTPGTAFNLSDLSVINTTTPVQMTGNISPVAQIVEFTATNIQPNLTYRIDIDGNYYEYVSISGDSQINVMSGIYNDMLSATGVIPSISGNNLIVTAATPGISFSFQASVVDNIAPIISFPNNTPQTLRGGTISTSTVSMNEDGTIYFFLSGTSVTTTGEIEAAVSSLSGFVGVFNASGIIEYTVTPGSLLRDGSYFAIGVDIYGNISSPTNSWLTVDNTAPILSTFTGTHYTNQNIFNITGTTEANIGLEISGNNGVFTGTALSDGSFSIPVTLTQNTGNLLEIKAIDSVGNSTTLTTTFYHDNIAPTLTIPTSGGYTNMTGWTFTGSTNPLANIQIADSTGNVIQSLQADNSGNFQISLTLVSNQLNQFVVSSTDEANNQATGSLTIIQDSIIPSLLLQPTPSITSGTDLIVSGTTKPDSILTLLNGTGNYSTTSSNTGYFSISIPLMINTGNDIGISVHDQAGNIGTGSLSIIQDSIPNSLIIGTPGQFTQQDSLTVTGSTKPNSSIEIAGGLTTMTGSSDNNGLFSVNIPLNQNSINNLIISSMDELGNISTGSVIVTHDNIAPTVNLSTTSGTTYNTTIVLNGTTQGSSQITVTGGATSVYGVSDLSGNFSLSVPLNTGAINNLTVTAVDQAGNSGSTSIQIVQDAIPIFLNMNTTTRYTNQESFTFTGSTKALANITISGGTGTINLNADSSGNFQAVVGLNLNVANNLIVTVTDSASGSYSTGSTVIHDNISPAITLNPYSSFTNSNTINLIGTTESNSTISATINGNIFTGIADGTGNFSMSIPLSLNVLNVINLSATDLAGNIGTGSASILQDSTGPAISNVSVTPYANGSSLTVNYNFQTNESSTSTLYIGTGNSVLATTILQQQTSGTNHIGTLVGLNASDNYYYIIQSIDQAGNSTYSTVGTVSVSNINSPTISNLNISEITSTTAKISFNVSDSNFLTANATGSLSISGMTITPIISKTSGYNTGSTNLEGLLPNSTYSFTLSVTNDYGKTTTQTGSFSTLNLANLNGGNQTYESGAQLNLTSSGVQELNNTNLAISTSSGTLTISGNIAIVFASGWDGILYGPTYLDPSNDKNGNIQKLGSLISGLNTNEFTYTGTVIGTIKAGSDLYPLQASGGNFIVNTVINQPLVGQTAYIYRSNDGISWEVNSPDTTCQINSSNQCNFQTNHLTYFSFVNVSRTSVPSTGNNNGGGSLNPITLIGGGGGGAISMTRDNCPNGDKSPSYYDGKCTATMLISGNNNTMIITGQNNGSVNNIINNVQGTGSINTVTGNGTIIINNDTGTPSSNKVQYKTPSGNTYTIIKNSDGTFIYKNSKSLLSPKFNTAQEIKKYLDGTTKEKIDLNIDYKNPLNQSSTATPTKTIKIILFESSTGKKVTVNKKSNGKFVYIDGNGIQSKEFNTENEIFKYLEKNYN